jgi:ABC-2 type transport system ATP-binding protein
MKPQPKQETVIRVKGISKTFKLPHEKTNSIKGLVVNIFRKDKSFEKQHVLKDISFEIKKGEFFGIVGKNGSGKSTLLKLLAGIYSPDQGSIEVDGKLTPFIELGVGFNPELTGRENVFLNGALLGFNRADMRAMYDDIVKFAELGRFMEQKLKNYSSGMQVRLAFSIAIRVKSDILVLDEVLAVGDEAFQQKCIDIFENYKARKQTVVLVTHDMEIVRRFCSRAMLLDKGEIASFGQPQRVAGVYSKMNEQELENTNHQPDLAEPEEGQEKGKPKSHVVLNLLNAQGKATTRFDAGQTLHVHVSWPETLEGVRNVGVAIVKNSGEMVHGGNTFAHPPALRGSHIDYEVSLDIGPGKYYLMAGLFGKDERKIVDFLDNGPQFAVQKKPQDTTMGIARLAHKWKTK